MNVVMTHICMTVNMGSSFISSHPSLRPHHTVMLMRMALLVTMSRIHPPKRRIQLQNHTVGRRRARTTRYLPSVAIHIYMLTARPRKQKAGAEQDSVSGLPIFVALCLLTRSHSTQQQQRRHQILTSPATPPLCVSVSSYLLDLWRLSA